MESFLSTLSQFDVSRLGSGTLTTMRILLIITIAWIAVSVLQRALRVVRMRIASRLDDRDAARRADTIGRVFRYIVTVGVGAVATMLVLSELGISLAPILGAAGVVGLAVGFGAQSLVKDYFAGFFILFEDQIRTGDVVRVGDHGGLVEEITLRHLRLRDYDGNVHFVPNGTITTVVNMSRTFAQSVMDVRVAYRENVDEVYAVMREVARELRADEAFATRILDDLEIAGVDKLDASAVVIRCRFKTAPLEQWSVRREYQRRLKQAFDAHGIEIPFPHLTVYAGAGKDGSAPAFGVRMLEAK